MLLDSPAFVTALVRPGFPVDTVHTDNPYASGIDEGGQCGNHAVVLPVVVASVLAREGEERLSVVAKHLIFHIAAEVVAPPFVVFYMHFLYTINR